MSVVYCDQCDKQIDTDFDAEHFDEHELNSADRELLKRTTADLSIKSMLFDMDVDIETLTLTPKSKSQEPNWMKGWKDKQRESDNDPASPEQAWA